MRDKPGSFPTLEVMQTPPDNPEYAPSSLPPRRARVLAFLSIVVGGVCGGLIGYGFADLTCTTNCAILAGAAGVLGAVVGAVGVGVVAILALRAMGEWNTRSDSSP